MRIVLAPDSFKESMTAPQAAAAMTRGVQAVQPDAQCVELPLSDGGEGFTDAVAAALGARVIEVTVHNALGRPVTGRLALGDEVAVLEVASAVGLDRIARAERDVLRADSRGAGELLRAALDHVRPGGRIVVGLGGSATNDGGAGLLVALGARLLDADGAELAPSPGALAALERVDLSGLDPRLGQVSIRAACDVTHVLLGPHGASAVFGPQKGADPAQVKQADAALARLVRTVDAAVPRPGGESPARWADEPGAGAAGGLGWALLALCGARLERGLELVARTVGLDEAIEGADLVLTGEGRVDAQSLSGKVPGGVAAHAARAGVPCLVLAGSVAPDADALLGSGVSALLPIVPGVVDLERALADGPANLERAVANALRLIDVGAALA
ncbi:glycerate kinase [Brachybacterium huguangmaarense]|uniref:Glycerate kinase n=1 Tax=Brachybacterium huguangmaarense TaxID=1652028 RepID=A0ABY6G311_9MICO|nr:glycerate kinase [Brachybacterium huguangmaarense]UYG17594.1 glycerate kinase [Brachybacterium huguangmaarense]